MVSAKYFGGSWMVQQGPRWLTLGVLGSELTGLGSSFFPAGVSGYLIFTDNTFYGLVHKIIF